MPLTNAYATLEEVQDELQARVVYTATTISFTSATKVIADTARGLRRFATGDTIRVAGSGSNNGLFTVATGGNPAQVIVNEALTNEAAGANVTLSQVSSLASATDPSDDETLVRAINAASRAIDNYTHRRFYAASDTRYYTALDHDILKVDDLLSVTTLKTDDDGDRVYETTWATTDYDLMPFNAQKESPARPYTWLQVTPNGNNAFPTNLAKGVQVAGSFGFSATAPADIKKACILMAIWLYKRKDAVFGVAGMASLGQIVLRIERDPDVRAILDNHLPAEAFWHVG